MIGEPYEIADIGLDFTGALGNISSSDVFAITHSGRKRRSEIAVAIDRQGVNIYDVNSTATIQSSAANINRCNHHA